MVANRVVSIGEGLTAMTTSPLRLIPTADFRLKPLFNFGINQDTQLFFSRRNRIHNLGIADKRGRVNDPGRRSLEEENTPPGYFSQRRESFPIPEDEAEDVPRFIEKIGVDGEEGAG